MSGFAMIPDAIVRKMHGAGGNSWAMLLAVARQSHFDDKWTCAQLDEYAGCPTRTGRHARADLKARGVITRNGKGWQLTGNPLPVDSVKRQPIAGEGEDKAATHCRSDRQPIAGTPYIERTERLTDGTPKSEEEPPPTRLREIRARKKECQESIARAMGTLRKHCESVGIGFAGADAVRPLLTNAATDGLDVVAIAKRLVSESPLWAGCDKPGVYWAKDVRLPAIIAEARIKPVDTTPDTIPKDASRLYGILATTRKLHPKAPDDFIFSAVAAEARALLKRHNLTNLAAITAWLEKSNAA